MAESSLSASSGPSSRVVSARRSHKSLDARRRRREAAVIDRLGSLSCPPSAAATASSAAQSSSQRRACGQRRVRSQQQQRDRLAILEASAQRIEMLEALVQTLSQRSNALVPATAVPTSSAAAASASLPPASSTLHLSSVPCGFATAAGSASCLPAAAGSLLSSPQCADLLAYACSHHSLYSALVVHSRLALVLVDVSSGVLLDVSAAFLQLCGWSRPTLVNVPMSPPFYFDSSLRRYGAHYTAADERAFLPQRNRPLMRAVSRTASSSDDGDVDEQQAELVPLVGCRQYPSVLSQLQQWMEGRLASFKGPIRKRWADGRLYELETAVWSVETRETREADGSRRYEPSRALLIAAIDDCVAVDEL